MSAVIQADAFAGTAHQRPRPSRYDKALRRAAAEAIIPEIERWVGEGEMPASERERIVELLASRVGDDGYQIARGLEREGFEPNAELVEILDGLDTHSVHADAVRVWLAETGANPKLSLGAVVPIPARMKEHAGVVGEIIGIDRARGEYTICCESLGHVREGLGTRGLIFAREDVEALSQAGAQ